MNKLTFAFAAFLSGSALATTLPEALVNAYNNNPELIAAREQLKVTDEKMYQAFSGFLPSVSFQGTKTRQKSDAASAQNYNPFSRQITSITEKSTPWNQTKSTNTAIQIKQNLFNGGQSVTDIRVAKYFIESGRADLVSKEQEILFNSINAYLDVILSKKILEINKENVSDYEKKYKATQEKFDAGLEKKSDLANAASKKAAAETKLIQATGKYSDAVATYIKVIGLEPEDLRSSESLGVIPKNQLELIRIAQAYNPALQNVIYQQKIADINVFKSVATMFPQIDIIGTIAKSYSYQRGQTTPAPYANSKSIALQLTIPIYQQGVEYSKTRGASAEAARFKYLVKNSKAEISQKSTQAWNNYLTSLDAVKSAEEAIKAGTIALEEQQRLYEEGIGSLTDLLDYQENLYNYKITIERSKNDANLSYYQLMALTGNLTAKGLSLATKIYNPAKNYDKVKMQIIGY